MNTLYLHLGLHKTATTAMQKHVFTEIEGVNFLSRNLDDRRSTYYQIGEYCFSQRKPKEKLELIREDLGKNLESESVIISEEWFTSDGDAFFRFSNSKDVGCKWEERLGRLAELCEPFSVKVLLTTRDPKEGLFSYYCEMLRLGYGKQHRTFGDFIRKGNDAGVYHFERLSSTVNLLFSDILYLPYELSESNEYFKGVCEWLGIPEVVSVPIINDREKGKDVVSVKGEAEHNWLIFARRVRQYLQNRHSRLADSVALKGAYRLIKKIIGLSQKEIDYPTQEDEDYIRANYSFLQEKLTTQNNNEVI